MKSPKLKMVVLLLLVYTFTSSCITLQQPLPGSLWGNWAFVQTGTIINGSNERLVNYRNVCHKEGDRLHFSSDNKMSLRWYDESCMIHHYSVGRYHVVGNTIKIDLADSRQYQDSPFPPIQEFRIIRINETTLKLEEIASESRRERHQGKPSGPEVLVFVFMKLD
ncbi:lipocalin family protein [Aequorivita marina]|uniref:lipocalin family protein n=1 Tax=Aequorivita marina TaxID=3073654 RepID=UPI002874CF44|nr:lipocalin family protein [Aequorivita sp. S2608]MDS1299034.1 lipocalin family protein [Aequorivita sp. S2608]